MIRIAALLSLLLAILPLWSQHVDSGAGEYGFQMLKITASPQSAGMGGTCALGADDAFGFIGNPVAGAYSGARGVTITSQAWLFDTRLTNIGVSAASGRHSFGFAFRNLDYGAFELRDYQGDRVGEYHPIDLNLMANYAIRFLPDAFLGVNLGALYEKINTASAVGFTSDIGTAWKTPLDGMTISGAVKSMGATSKMSSKSVPLPLTGELGVTQEYDLADVHLTGDLRGVWSVDDDAPKAALGVTAGINKFLTIRTGYRLNYDIESFSAGFGLRLKRTSIDYAYLPIGQSLDDVHYLGITYHY
jgi:hypothetical protein